MNPAVQIFEKSPLPEVPIGDWLNSGVEWVEDHLQPVLDFFVMLVEDILYDNILDGLLWVPPLILAVVFALIAWALRGWKFGLVSLVGMLLIQAMPTADMWLESMRTLVLTLIAVAGALVIAIPLGILSAKNRAVSTVVRPVLDFMQTLPAFVYLLPALFFFGIGTTAGVACSFIFCAPPAVRLTELGIRQVDPEMVEAGHAFGATPRSILGRIQIPLAMPTIMAGINQVIMLALAMVVIAGLVGAQGLGTVVIEGINRLQLPKGFEGGLAVVILAIYLDRVTAGLGDRSAAARVSNLAV